MIGWMGKFNIIVAAAYLIIMPLNIKIYYSFYLQDLLSPFFVFFALRGIGGVAELLKPPTVWLLLGLAWSALAVLIHFSLKDAYVLSIFLYMSVVFFFFRGIRFPEKFMFLYGAGVLSAMLLYFCWIMFFGRYQVYEVYSNSSLDFLSRRFFFTFCHPNLTGAFYALPVLCVLLGGNVLRESLGKWWLPLMLLLLCVLCIPLLFTVSKHMLISAALILGWLVFQAPEKYRNISNILSFLVLGLVFLVFYLTVLFPFFH